MAMPALRTSQIGEITTFTCPSAVLKSHTADPRLLVRPGGRSSGSDRPADRAFNAPQHRGDDAKREGDTIQVDHTRR